MQDSKFFLRSMTVLGALLTSVMMIWDGSITAQESAELQSGITNIVTQGGEIVGLVMVIVGRFRAKSGVKLVPGK